MTNLTLSDKTYNFLKWFVTIFLPALGAFYFGLSKIFGFPGGEDVVGSLALLATFLGTIIGLSSRNYEPPVDGEAVIERDPGTGKTVVGLELSEDPSLIIEKDQILFNVVNRDDEFWEAQH